MQSRVMNTPSLFTVNFPKDAIVLHIMKPQKFTWAITMKSFRSCQYGNHPKHSK